MMLGDPKTAQSRHAEAEQYARAGLAMRLRLSGPEGYHTGWAYYSLGDALQAGHKFRDALAAQKQALSIMRKWLPPEHESIALTITRVIGTLAMAGESHALADVFPVLAEVSEWESIFRQLSAKKPSRLSNDDPAFVASRALAQLIEVYLDLGRELSTGGKAKEAEDSRRNGLFLLDSLQGQLADSPDLLGQVYWHGALALIKDGQPQPAKALCGKLANVPAKSGRIHNEAAWLLAQAPDPTNRDPALAVALAIKAVAAQPKSGDYRNTLGVARYGAGDFRQAISDLEESVSLRKGGDGHDFFFLAMAHWQIGDKKRARHWYDRGLAWLDGNLQGDARFRVLRAEAEMLLSGQNPKVGSRAPASPTPTTPASGCTTHRGEWNSWPARASCSMSAAATCA